MVGMSLNQTIPNQIEIEINAEVSLIKKVLLCLRGGIDA